MDDEDTYGFGSFSDLFDAGPAAAKRLDVSTLSRFCMSERLLSRFQQQQQRDERGVTFQHVAAKFDGVGVDGGLGALTLTTLEHGGIVWLQTTQLDSDALERRKKELQDITNRGSALDDAKSAAALFVALRNVAKVQPMTVQNTVQGVEMQLSGGHRLELTFMPGPFADATHRDKFLTALKLLDAKKETQGKEKEVMQTPGRRDRAVAAKEKTPRKVAEQKEEFRQLVRKYTTMDPLSEEGLAIAQQVQAGTGYHLGPTTKQMPQFSADAEYRKKTVEELSGYLQRMNQEWSDADSHRQLHTKARHSRNDDDLFEYTDTDTGAQIPPRVYEQRYLEYVKAHEVNPVLRMFPGSKKATKSDKSVQNGTTSSAERWTSDESVSSVESTASVFTTTLGVDISSSCIIGKDFFSADNIQVPADPHTYGAEDKVFRAFVDKARMKLLDSYGFAFAQISGKRASQAESQCDHSTSHAQLTASVAGHSSTRKRARERRRSLILPTADDLKETAQTVASTSLQAANGGDVHQPRSKRSRSSSDKVAKSQRKARRQSIVSTVDIPVVTNSDETKKAIAKRGTPQSTEKSPRSRHPVNSYSRATSSLEMVGDEDSDLCQLCYGERALVYMNPCDHVVCESCWRKLSPSPGKNGTSSRRVCPWDREPVTKR